MKRKKHLGDASGFVQGGNQVQTYILLFAIILALFYLLPNVNKIFDTLMGKPKPEEDDPNKNVKLNPNPQINAGTGNSSSGGGFQPQKENVPTNLGYYDLQRWLLAKAGFYNGAINLGNVYSHNTELTNFSRSTGVGVVGQTKDWNPLIIDYLRNKGVLNGYKPLGQIQKPKRTLMTYL
jgi:hypothetical protein